MSSLTGPTGRTRYREQKRWFRPSLLVLQIETNLWESRWNGFDSDEDIVAVWRDATIEDLSVIGKEK